MIAARAGPSLPDGRSAVPLLKAIEIRRFTAPDAVQGVAVGQRAVYVIADRAIAKYDKASGRKLTEWSDTTGEVVHLNSCTVRKARLYCAHSNFPHLPMTSSIEIFDAGTLAHVGHVSLGLTSGSLTWLDYRAGHWWLCFANYSGAGGAPSRGTAWTELAEYDRRWQPRQAWVFPPAVLRAFGRMSASGGAWGPDGYLYVSGHDRPELYVLRLPEFGSVLEQVATISVPGHGQAFGWEPSGGRVLYMIDRSTRTIISSRIPPVPPAGK
ncbi:MAG TPA: cycloisomerase [Pararhizobium sp.]|nr:cycloisomerase [Pararhizobium sp.]